MRAPRLARLLIGLCTPADQREDVLGDLEETYRRRAEAGAARAWLAAHADALLIALAMSWQAMPRPAALRHALSGTDLKLGLRLMYRQPVLTATAVISLTVGIALATVGFAFMEALLYSRLPFERGDRIVFLEARDLADGAPARLTRDDYAVLAAGTTTLEHLGGISGSRENVTVPSGQVLIGTTAGLTPSTFAYLPYAPVEGRLLSPLDARPEAPPVAMVREGFRRSALAGVDAVGATIGIGGREYTIVGVAPDAFEFPNSPDVWLPLDERFLSGRALPASEMRMMGILAPGRSVEALQRQLDALSTSSLAPRPDAAVRVAARPFTDLGPMGRDLSIASVAAVAAVLLVIAANVGNLMLARSFARTREFSLRAALGASRARLVGQVTLEVVMMTAMAAIIGTIAADAVLRLLNGIDEMPFWVDFTAGARANALVVLATMGAVAVAGAWPALRATRHTRASSIGDQRVSDARFGKMAGVMVVTQIAFSIAMLHGALVVAQALDRFSGASLDLPRNVLTTYVGVNAERPGNPEGGPVTAHAIETWLADIPGVMAVGAGTALPRHSPSAGHVEIEPIGSVETAREAHIGLAPEVQVTAGYFDALDATLLSGRLLTSSDFLPGSRPVAVVSAPFTRMFFGGANAVGHRFRAVDGGATGPWTEIVGVVPDLGLNIADDSLAGGYYVPLRPDTNAVYLALRVAGDPLTFATPVRRALASHDPETVINRVQLLEDEAHEDRAFFKWFSIALLAMGAVTLTLALAGVYAMMSLIVTRRTREIGVRIALGATAGRVVRSVAGRAAWQVGLGGAAGLGLAMLSLQLRGALVSRIGDGDPWTLPVVMALLAAAGLAASWLPLRRALGVQAADALRAE